MAIIFDKSCPHGDKLSLTGMELILPELGASFRIEEKCLQVHSHASYSSHLHKHKISDFDNYVFSNTFLFWHKFAKYFDLCIPIISLIYFYDFMSINIM